MADKNHVRFDAAYGRRAGHSFGVDAKIEYYPNGIPSFIEAEDGTKIWYYADGTLHHILYSIGDHCWYQDGNLHREDGPALDYFGDVKIWFWHGKKLDCKSQEEFERYIKLKAFW